MNLFMKLKGSKCSNEVLYSHFLHLINVKWEILYYLMFRVLAMLSFLWGYHRGENRYMLDVLYCVMHSAIAMLIKALCYQLSSSQLLN